MTAIRDPYPPELIDDESVIVGAGAPVPEAFSIDAGTREQIRVLNRIALALEQLTVLIADRSQPVQNAPGAALTAPPPVRPAPALPAEVCPIHGTPWKVVPAGISKKTGKAYDSFRACSTAGCDQRPR